MHDARTPVNPIDALGADLLRRLLERALSRGGDYADVFAEREQHRVLRWEEGRVREARLTCAVPVFPAILMSGKGRRPRPAVPGPLTTSLIAWRMNCFCSAGKPNGLKIVGLDLVSSCGITCLPVAMREAITASCSGFASM